jgi:hypothetical protein
MVNRLGPYIQKLMLIVIDKEQDDDVKQLAWDELGRLSVNINDFLDKNRENSIDKVINKDNKEKQLLQEDK